LINRSRLPFKDLAGLSQAVQRPWPLNDQSSRAWHWSLTTSSVVYLRISYSAAAIAWSLCRFSISPHWQDSLLITAFVLWVCPSSPCDRCAPALLLLCLCALHEAMHGVILPPVSHRLHVALHGLAMEGSTGSTADKKRNKLGYHRTSVACGKPAPFSLFDLISFPTFGRVARRFCALENVTFPYSLYIPTYQSIPFPLRIPYHAFLMRAAPLYRARRERRRKIHKPKRSCDMVSDKLFHGDTERGQQSTAEEERFAVYLRQTTLKDDARTASA
jgi:hypothetical protein